MTEQFYSMRDAAALAGISATWLCKLMARGIVARPGKVGATWMFSTEDIERIKATRQRMPRAGRPKGE